MSVSTPFKTANWGGYFDQERQKNPMLYDREGEPIDDHGYAEEDYDHLRLDDRS